MMRLPRCSVVLAALLGWSLPVQAESWTPDVATTTVEAVTAAPSSQTPQMGEVAASSDTPRASVAAIMRETGQALLWDTVRGEYAVVREGQSFREFRVTAIRDEQVVLSRGNQHFVLPRTSDTEELARRAHASIAVRPESSPTPVNRQAETAPEALAPNALAADQDPAAASAAAQPAAPAAPPAANSAQPARPPAPLAPIDPYAAAAPAAAPAATVQPAPAPAPAPAAMPTATPAPAPAVVDPYQQNAAPVRPVAPSLPSSLLESTVTSRPSPSQRSSNSNNRRNSAAVAPVRRDSAAASAAESAATPEAVASSEAGTASEQQRDLSRKEFDAALVDFDALGKQVSVSQGARGVRVDTLAPGSLPYRMGLRAGDEIVSVDGRKLRDMNDAAAIYARLMEAKRFALKVQRGAETIMFRYRFRR
ncbi:PDZ domain-containing protein [Haliangium ochraceum]|uniref:PDZ/DHR/GLGF domain protein n=1 Tax=Haliangium ochraceum (strain DSM 14365 / JCM 11303 / SMP-2) TaxID=502025 RepID=D0LK94_HALO1|nr:PDZ domain-containing protein [Haliangium ochraceum]ACY13128.1 PDZ/DHR/GLGF domain protein [Haliangium ochraceum DSM 14365]